MKNATLHLRVRAPLREALERLAARERRKLSAYVESVLEQHAERALGDELVERGRSTALTSVDQPTANDDPLEPSVPGVPPRTRPRASAQKPKDGLCPHRVPIGSYCKRCEEEAE